MKRRSVSILKNLAKWLVAGVGIFIIARFITIRDQVMVVGNAPTLTVTQAAIVEARSATGERHNPLETDTTFVVEMSDSGESRTISRDDIVNAPDRKTVDVKIGDEVVAAELRGMTIEGDLQRNPTVTHLLITDPQAATSYNAGAANGKWITPDQVSGEFKLLAPRPLIQRGLASLVREANPWLLVAAVMVFPGCFLLTTLRWHLLLKVLDIRLPIRRTFALNMVGSFYNSFLPGSTGGDIIKAYYVAKQTPHKTRGVISVFVDRVVGLMALVMMGGSLSALQYFMSDNPTSPTAVVCRQVALVCGVILVGFIVGSVVMLSDRIRRGTGMEFILKKLPMQKLIGNVQHVGQMYKRRPLLILAAFLITLPVHLTVVISAMLAGHAFGLPISEAFYFVCVPVIKLVSAIPISPQGAGVMETFALILTSKQGATASQALALAMSIRVVELVWSLMGGLFVLKGGFSLPTDAAAEEIAVEGSLHENAPPNNHNVDSASNVDASVPVSR